MTSPTEYPPIADHGLIGDLQTSALVAADGTIDWFCCPRFDSPSVFAALLDHQRGGYCRIRPREFSGPAKQLYFPDTAVLITRFMTEAGTGEVVDFMPVAGDLATDRHRLVRLVRCVRGTVDFEVEVVPRFDYGRRPHRAQITGNSGVMFRCGDHSLALHGFATPGDTGTADVRITETQDVRAALTLTAGQVRGIVLDWGAEEPAQAVGVDDVERAFEDAVRFWHAWLARSTYRGRWREILHRSAITLKLMTYAPTGAIIAAPTAGLPEQIGGERNWDYRYTWIRDASFAVSSLLGMGFTDEADGLRPVAEGPL